MSDQTQPMPPAQPPRPPVQGPPPERSPGLWRQATSTTGGRIATGVALALSGLLLLGLLGAGVYGLAQAVDAWGDRRERVAQRGDGFDDDGFGQRGRGMGPGMGPEMRQRDGDDLLGGGGLLGRLGSVQHGEVTVTGSDGKPVTLTVQRGVVTAASATSLSVRSDDGFSQTYAVNTATRVTGGTAASLQKDASVMVLARKADQVALQVRTVPR